MVPVRLEDVPRLFSEGIESADPTPAERRRRRASLLAESPGERARRSLAWMGHAARARHFVGAFAGARFVLRERKLTPAYLPDPARALASPDGVCGLAGDLSPAAMMDAYSRGLILFAPLGPPLWWSGSQRAVARPGLLGRRTRALALAADRGLGPAIDRAFDDVLARCARADRGEGRFGLSPKAARAYAELHDAGFAHSVELADSGGALSAGLFGISVGRIFVTEFAFGPAELVEAALVVLDRHLAEWGYALHEARLGPGAGVGLTQATRRLGFATMARRDFIDCLKANLCGGRLSRWRIDREIASGNCACEDERERVDAKTLASAA